MLAAAVVVGGYVGTLRRYGFELADEGTLLAQIDRVAHGQVPYRDFHTGYGPGLFYLNVLLGRLLGMSTDTVRGGLAAVHGLRAAALVALVATLGGRLRHAAALVLVLVAFFLPVAPGVCTPINVPYAGWYADALGLAGLAVLARSERPSALAVVGASWGMAFAFKQNSGLLGLAAAAVTVVLRADTGASDRGGGRIVGWLAAAGLTATALVLLHAHLDATLALVFLVPLLPLLWALARTRTRSGVLREVAWLLAAFLAVVVPWVAVVTRVAGWEAVRTDLLQIGTDTATVYFTPYPTLAGLRSQLAGVSGTMRVVRIVAETSCFALLPLLDLGAAMLVASGRVRSRAAAAIVVTAAVGYLQVYPRMDFWHLLAVAPTSLAALAVVGATLGPSLRCMAVVGAVVLGAVRMVPNVPVEAAIASPSPPATDAVARLPLRWDLVQDERLRAIPAVVAALRGRERVAGFPALGVFNFALDAPSPWRHDYFFPGRPTPAEERALAVAIARDPPDEVTVLEAAEGRFATAAAAHPDIAAVLAARFVERRRIGPYRLLVPRTPG